MLPFPQPLGKVEVIEFKAEEFPWITIKFKDGTILRFKVVITGVMRVDDPLSALRGGVSTAGVSVL